MRLDCNFQVRQPVQIIEGRGQYRLALFLGENLASLLLESKAEVFEVADKRKPVVGNV